MFIAIVFIAIVDHGGVTKGRGRPQSVARLGKPPHQWHDALGGIPARAPASRLPVRGPNLLEHALVSMQIDRTQIDLESYCAGLQGDIKMLAGATALAAFAPAALAVFLKSHLRVYVENSPNALSRHAPPARHKF